MAELAGTAAVLEEVFFQYSEEMTARARKLLDMAKIPECVADAHDVVIEAYIAALACPDELENPRAYIYSVIHSKVAQLVRTRARHASLEEKRGADPQRWDCQMVVPDFSDLAVDRVALQSALLELPVPSRTALYATDAMGFTRQETADLIGRHPGTVAQQVWRARVTLKAVLTFVVGVLLLVAGFLGGNVDCQAAMAWPDLWDRARGKDKDKRGRER